MNLCLDEKKKKIALFINANIVINLGNFILIVSAKCMI